LVVFVNKRSGAVEFSEPTRETKTSTPPTGFSAWWAEDKKDGPVTQARISHFRTQPPGVGARRDVGPPAWALITAVSEPKNKAHWKAGDMWS
jgi:hypothetical protein